MANSIGLIDPGYNGNLLAKVDIIKNTKQDVLIKKELDFFKFVLIISNLLKKFILLVLFLIQQEVLVVLVLQINNLNVRMKLVN